MIDVSTFYRQIEHIQDELVEAVSSQKSISPLVDKRLIQLIDTKCECKNLLEEGYFKESCQKAKCLSLIISGLRYPSSKMEVQAFQEKYALYKSNPAQTPLKEVEEAFTRAMGFLFTHLNSNWPLQESEIDPDDPVQSWIFTARLAYQRCQQ